MEGPHFTFVDPRNHDDPKRMIQHALRIVRLFAEEGYGRDCIVISVSPGAICRCGTRGGKELTHHVALDSRDRGGRTGKQGAGACTSRANQLNLGVRAPARCGLRGGRSVIRHVLLYIGQLPFHQTSTGRACSLTYEPLALLTAA